MFDSVVETEHTFASMRGMARTRVRKRRAVVLVTLAVVGGAWAGPVARAVSGPDVHRVSRATYVVRPGDSVWDIAERVAPGTDPRPIVDAIVASNDVDPGSLTPGQTLVIPTA